MSPVPCAAPCLPQEAKGIKLDVDLTGDDLKEVGGVQPPRLLDACARKSNVCDEAPWHLHRSPPDHVVT